VVVVAGAAGDGSAHTTRSVRGLGCTRCVQGIQGPSKINSTPRKSLLGPFPAASEAVAERSGLFSKSRLVWDVVSVPPSSDVILSSCRLGEPVARNK
jgi:hypothetical protein